MSLSGVNLAVTQNGEQYNRLRRPDDFLSTMPAPSSSQDALRPSLPLPMVAKRALDTTDTNDENAKDARLRKRTRPNEEQAEDGRHSAPRPANVNRPFNPIYGMQSMFPGIMEDDDNDLSDESTNEALAYLRSVR